MQRDLGIVPNPSFASAFLIEQFIVQPALNRVCRGAHVAHLEPKAMQLLVFMAEHSGEVLFREVLLNAVWGDAFVTDQVLSNTISQIRHAFGDAGKDYIQTIPKSGYLLNVRPSPADGNGTDGTLDQVSAFPSSTSADASPALRLPCSRPPES